MMTKSSPNAEASLRVLLDIMAALRHPESGCAWDLKQTHASITPYTIEEAYEVADAALHGTPDDLRDELGDLLLQVVFQARIGEENGDFDFAAIAEGISAKMTRRHPHIFAPDAFGTVTYADEAEQRQAWEAIKAAERKDKKDAKGRDTEGRDLEGKAPIGKDIEEKDRLTDEVPVSLPPVIRAVKLQKCAARVGFDWPDPEPVIAKVREELDEVAAELAAARGTHEDARIEQTQIEQTQIEQARIESVRIDKSRIADEIGDVLFAVINLARKSGVDPESALMRCNAKFTRRFNAVEGCAEAAQIPLAEASLEQMESWWNDIKMAEKTT